MIYDLRQYTADPERWFVFCEWGLTQAFPVLFEPFDLPLVEFFETLPVEDLEDQTFNGVAGVHWLLSWDSVEDRHRGMN